MPWTQIENQIIKDNFGKITLPQIIKLLPNEHSYYAMRSHCQRMGLYRDSKINRLPLKNTYNLEYFKEPNLSNSFIAGRISADGCILKYKGEWKMVYKVAIKDECIINDLIKEFNFSGIKYYHESKLIDNYECSKLVSIRLSSFDKNAVYLNTHFNLTPNKTMRLGPTNLNDIHLNWAFIIGNLDGDGTIGYEFNIKSNHETIYLHFCSASPHIIRWIKGLFDEYFPNEQYNKSKEAEIGYNNQEHYYRFKIGGLRAAVIIDYLSQYPVNKLDRKWKAEKVVNYINKKKSEHPELFKTLNLTEIQHLLPENSKAMPQNNK